MDIAWNKKGHIVGILKDYNTILFTSISGRLS